MLLTTCGLPSIFHSLSYFRWAEWYSCWLIISVQVPVVIRGPGGVGRQLGAEHSQRLESYFQSIPGVQLVACSTVANAKALLKSAIRSDNPVIFFEHVLLYNVKGKSDCFIPASRQRSTICVQEPYLTLSTAKDFFEIRPPAKPGRNWVGKNIGLQGRPMMDTTSLWRRQNWSAVETMSPSCATPGCAMWSCKQCSSWKAKATIQRWQNLPASLCEVRMPFVYGSVVPTALKQHSRLAAHDIWDYEGCCRSLISLAWSLLTLKPSATVWRRLSVS